MVSFYVGRYYFALRGGRWEQSKYVVRRAEVSVVAAGS